MKAYRNAALIIGSLIAVLVVSYGQIPSELFVPVSAAFGARSCSSGSWSSRLSARTCETMTSTR